MTYFFPERISSTQIAGAVCEAINDDIRVNASPFQATPQVLVTPVDPNYFEIALSLDYEGCQATSTFILSHAEAVKAARAFKDRHSTSNEFGVKVSKAMGRLEINRAANQLQALDIQRPTTVL